jgi:hypothetical protein
LCYLKKRKMERRVLLVTGVGERVGMIRATWKIGIGERMEIWIGYGTVTEVKGKRMEVEKTVSRGTSSAEDRGSGTDGDEGEFREGDEETSAISDWRDWIPDPADST